MAEKTFAFEDLKRLLVKRAGLPEEDIVDDPNLTFDQMGLDSLGFIEVQMAVQEEFGVSVPEEEANQITTLGQAIEYLNRALADRG